MTAKKMVLTRGLVFSLVLCAWLWPEFGVVPTDRDEIEVTVVVEVDQLSAVMMVDLAGRANIQNPLVPAASLLPVGNGSADLYDV